MGFGVFFGAEGCVNQVSTVAFSLNEMAVFITMRAVFHPVPRPQSCRAYLGDFS